MQATRGEGYQIEGQLVSDREGWHKQRDVWMGKLERYEAHKKFKINRVFYPAAGYFVKGHDRCGSDASGRPASFLGAARGELIGWAGQRLHEIPEVPAATAQQHAAEHGKRCESICECDNLQSCRRR
jgi:hypothetical protein